MAKDKKTKAAKAEATTTEGGFMPTAEQFERVFNRKEVLPNWKAFSDFVVENGGPKIKPEHVGIVLTGYNPLFQKTDAAKGARAARSEAAAEKAAAREAAAEQRAADKKAKAEEAAEKKAARDEAAKEKAAKKTTSAAKASKPTPKASAGKAATKKAAAPAKAKKSTAKAAF